MWVSGHKEGTDMGSTLQHGFKLAGLPNLYGSFDDFMYLIAATATEDIVVRAPECLEVSDDEHLLIGVVAAWQQGHGKDQGTALLSTWLPMSAIRLTQTALAEIATAFASQNMVLRSRCSRQSGCVEHSSPSTPHLSSATLH